MTAQEKLVTWPRTTGPGRVRSIRYPLSLWPVAAGGGSGGHLSTFSATPIQPSRPAFSSPDTRHMAARTAPLSGSNGRRTWFGDSAGRSSHIPRGALLPDWAP